MSMNLKMHGAVCVLLGGFALMSTADWRLPGDNQGYEPIQPIAFSHRVHAGELDIDCQYCHFGARQSRHAGVPPASVCMNCHDHVTSSFDALLTERNQAELQSREPQRVVSPELRKLYDALALDEELNPREGVEPTPIEWVRVHNMPDFVFFDHRPHVARGIACETCHGPVKSMERMRQDSPMTMGWCIDCHRSNAVDPHEPFNAGGERRLDHVSTDCVTCHL